MICDKKATPKLEELGANEMYELQEDDFGEYLEKAYSGTYYEARKQFGSSKPIIAAYVAIKEEPPLEINEMLEGKLHAFLSS